MSGTFISIDQNSHVLWDTVPKLQALARHGWRGTHAVEDIDVAFTRQGATAGDDTLALAPERYYRSGNSDWGAALFYSDFLGRSPLDIRALEPYTGVATAKLAHRLGLCVDALYERFAQSDNWQLIGPSYAGDAHHHRVIGDLSVGEAAPFLRQLWGHAVRNLRQSVPERDAQARIAAWAGQEEARLEALLASLGPAAPLVQLYQEWMRPQVAGRPVALTRTSDLFAPRPDDVKLGLFSLFLERYDECAALYNQAVTETACGLKPLRARDGELPFFAVWRRPGASGPGGFTRTALTRESGRLVSAGRDWPLAGTPLLPPLPELARDGLVCFAGKALLLVLQARLVPGGAALALPHQGSLYMPAAYALERLLRDAGLLPWPVQPVLRVRFRFLERLQALPTRIRLPDWLQEEAGGEAETSAAAFAEALPAATARAAAELEQCRDAAGRERLLAAWFAPEQAHLRELEARRRELAANPETRELAAAAWDEKASLERHVLERFVTRLLRNLHLRNLEYWDSRGALQPWAIALGGEAFYDALLARAEIAPESGA
jgi:hypothetical protein